MSYAIKIEQNGYYTGKTYQYQYQLYPVCSMEKDKYKKYTNEEQAKKALSRLYKRVSDSFYKYDFEIVSVE